MYNGKELDEILGPKIKTSLMWSTPLTQGGGGGGRGQGAAGAGGRGAGGPGAAGAAGGRAGGQVPPVASGPFPVDPAAGVRIAPPAVAATPAATPAPATAGAATGPANKGFIAFEPMVAITDALNLAQKGIYKDLQSIPPGGSWEESFWVTTKGY
jgi:hypothetical protein